MEEAIPFEAQVKADLWAGRTPTPFHADKKKASKKANSCITLRAALEDIFEMYWRGTANADNRLFHIEECCDFFGADRPINEITTQDADKWIAELRSKELAASTIRGKCSAMTKMFNHFKKRNVVSSVPFFDLPQVGDNTRDRLITDEEFDELIRLFREEYDYSTRRREKSGSDYEDIFVFLMETGCRPIEAKSVEIKNLVNGRLTFKKTKNGLQRTIPLTAKAQAALERQAELRGAKPFEWATKPVVHHAWRWARVRMGLIDDPGFICYALRHTCGSRVYALKRDLLLTQHWLGHKDIKMTLRYAKLQPFALDEVRDLMDASSPETN
ncbi:MAG: site-specific integrase [Pseudomonadota bacterium]